MTGSVGKLHENTMKLNHFYCVSPLPQIFQEIGAVQSLKRIVMYSSNGPACALAKRALSAMDEEVPRRILSSVPNWKSGEVHTLLQQVASSAFSDRLQASVARVFM